MNIQIYLLFLGGFWHILGGLFSGWLLSRWLILGWLLSGGGAFVCTPSQPIEIVLNVESYPVTALLVTETNWGIYFATIKLL